MENIETVWKTIPGLIRSSLTSALSVTDDQLLNHLSGYRDSTIKKAICDQLPMAIVLINRAGQILYVNNKAVEYWDVKNREAVLGKSVTLFFPDRTRVFSLILMLQIKGRWEGILETKREDESKFQIFASLQRLYDENGDYLTTVGLAYQTGKDFKEQRLEDLYEETLKIIAEQGKDIYWKLNSELKFTFVSQMDEKLRGYHFSEVVGSSLIDQFTQFGKGQFAAFYRQRPEVPEPFSSFSGEFEMICKDGSTKWFEVNGHRMLNADGTIDYQGISKDITKRKTQEQLLIQGKENYLRLLAAVPTPLFVFSTRGKLLFHNAKAEQFLNAFTEDKIHNQAELLIHQNSVKQYFDTVVETNIAINDFEAEINLEGIEPKTVLLSISSTTFNETASAVVILNDITRIKNTELKLRESRSQLEEAQRNARIGHYLYDDIGKIFTISDSAADILRVPAQDIPLEQFIKAIATEHRSSFRSFLHQVIISDEPKYIDCRMLSLTSEHEFWVTISGKRDPVRDKSEKVYMGTMQDITVRKQHEIRMTESEQLWRSIITASPDQVIITDRAGRIKSVSNSTLQIFGYESNDDIKGLPVLTFIVKDDWQRAIEDYWTLFLTKKRSVKEYKAVRKNGSTLDFEVSAEIIYGLDGRIAGVIFIGRDISDWKRSKSQIEEQHQQLISLTEELKNSNEIKDKMFSIIGHDLRGPIGSLKSFINAVIDYGDIDPARIISIMRMMKKSVDSTFELTENLLQWARNQRGAVVHEPKLLPVALILDEQISLYTDTAARKSVNIIKKYPEDIVVYADEDMIRVVSRNLISNAVKFSKEKGRIIVSVTLQEDKAVVAVADDGIGMTKENIEKIFSKDITISTKGTGNETGVGLGLNLCKDFVAKNGGEFRVESVVGFGSTFSFTLPLRHS